MTVSTGSAAQLTHMVKTRDGGETIRIIKTLAVKGKVLMAGEDDHAVVGN